MFQCLSNSQQLFHHVFGVDAVKGPCAVFIFLFFCVLVVFVFVGWVLGGWGGMLTFSCTSTHTPCYAAAHSLALPRIRHATLLHVLLHFHTYVMLRARTAFFADGCKAWKGASNQQVPEKRLKWQNFAHNRGEFVKHLGGSPQKRVLLWPEHRL